jgi:hypothetical protein
VNSAPPLVTHAALVRRAVHWLKEFKHCNVVLSEMSCGWIEVPDAMGFSNTRHGSVLIECKAGRNDFRRDAQKPGRREGVGMGVYRYYLVPHGLVRSHEFETLMAGEPEEGAHVTNFKWGSAGWGLLWWDPRSDRITMQRTSQRFSPNKSAENLFLVSALSRVQSRLTEPLHEYIRWETSPIARRRTKPALPEEPNAMGAHA